MGCVQQAVLDFDEEVAAPWRPRLVAVPEYGDDAGRPVLVRDASPRRSRVNQSRVGACRPPAAPARRGDGAPSSAGTGRRPAAPVTASVSDTRRDSRVRALREPERLRLTHRGRRLAVVIALAAGVALGSWLAPLVSGGAGGDLRLAGQTSVTVESGDTLWSIASSVAGTSDVRDVIDRIRRLNGLHSADLVPGQVLQLP